MFFIIMVIIFLYSKDKDIFNPCICFLSITLVKYVIPGIIQRYTNTSYYLSLSNQHFLKPWIQTESFDKTALIVLLFTVLFSASYMFMTNLKDQSNISFQVTEPSFKSMLFAALFGILALLPMYPLLQLKLQGGDPYYFMKGFGVWHQIYLIFGFILSYLLVASPSLKTKIVGVFCTIPCAFYWGYVLNRKTNTIMYLVGLFIAVVNPFRFKIPFKAVALCMLGGGLFVFFFYVSRTSFAQSQLNEFFIYDLGRFDVLWGAIHSVQESYSYNPIYFLSQAPYSGYIPFIKELNILDPQESQIAIIGFVRHQIGGVPFDVYSRSYLIGNWVGVGFFAVLNGAVWGYIYTRSQKIFLQGSSVLIGLYAICWTDNIGINNVYFPTPAFIALLIFFISGGKFTLLRKEVSAK